jgi:uncharacterized protein YecE (DUF72 family)
MPILLGTAGWTIPKQHLALFPPPAEGTKPSHLERYATRFPCVEINSSFHRPHRRATWERWAATTPGHFRFAVKMPKAVTHTAQLANAGALLLPFFDAVQGLGPRLGPVLVQLPPKLAFDEALAQDFFTTLRELHPGAVVLEPRHPSWFSGPVDRLLRSFAVARAAADPPKGSHLAARPGGWPGLHYWRLHGSPRTYYSNYEDPWLQTFARHLHPHHNSSAKGPGPANAAASADAADSETWVIFDNTALGHATANAVRLQDALQEKTRFAPLDEGEVRSADT